MTIFVHVLEATATGTLSMVSMIANHQVRKGDEVHIIYSRRDETPDDLQNIFDNQVVLHELSMGGGAFPISIYKLRYILKGLSPDIVHLHSSYAGFIGRLATVGLKGMKIFYSPHCISFMRKDVNKLKIAIFVLFEFIATIRKSTYIACSNSENNEIKLFLPYVKTITLENAVDICEHEHEQGKRKPDRKRVVSVGGLRAQKNPEEYGNIAKRFQSHDVDFYWIGDGDEKVKSSLKTAGVKVTGWMDKADVISFLRGSNLYLSTARWEGMPVSLIEAMICNLPIIAKCSPGNIDVISDGISGLIYESEEDAYIKVDKFLKTPESNNSMSDYAYSEAINRFSIARFYNELEIIYRSNDS